MRLRATYGLARPESRGLELYHESHGRIVMAAFELWDVTMTPRQFFLGLSELTRAARSIKNSYSPRGTLALIILTRSLRYKLFFLTIQLTQSHILSFPSGFIRLLGEHPKSSVNSSKLEKAALTRTRFSLCGALSSL